MEHELNGLEGEARLEDSVPRLRDGNSQVSDKRRAGPFVEAGDEPVNEDEGSLAQCHVDTLKGERAAWIARTVETRSGALLRLDSLALI